MKVLWLLCNDLHSLGVDSWCRGGSQDSCYCSRYPQVPKLTRSFVAVIEAAGLVHYLIRYVMMMFVSLALAALNRWIVQWA
jgi:hypothetical protein